MTERVISLPTIWQKGESRLINANRARGHVTPILAARRYVSPRYRPLTPEEAETRRIAYALKLGEETAIAAREMAELIPPHLPTVTLVPIPSSTGNLEANRLLAQAIAAEYGPQANVVGAIRRVVPVESSCARRRRGIPGLSECDHQFERAGRWISLPVFFVDNVVTSGATLAAARNVFHAGSRLVFADASSPYPSRMARGFPAR